MQNTVFNIHEPGSAVDDIFDARYGQSTISLRSQKQKEKEEVNSLVRVGKGYQALYRHTVPTTHICGQETAKKKVNSLVRVGKGYQAPHRPTVPTIHICGHEAAKKKAHDTVQWKVTILLCPRPKNKCIPILSGRSMVKSHTNNFNSTYSYPSSTNPHSGLCEHATSRLQHTQEHGKAPEP